MVWAALLALAPPAGLWAAPTHAPAGGLHAARAAAERVAQARVEYEQKRAQAHKRMREAARGASPPPSRRSAGAAAHPKHGAIQPADHAKPAAWGAKTATAAKPPQQGGDHFEHIVPFLPAEGAPEGQGVVRVVNRGGADGTVAITAFDATGVDFGPVWLAVGARSAIALTAAELTVGAPGKGLPVGLGPLGESAWRLTLRSGADVDVYAYLRRDGRVVATLHGRVARLSGVRSVAMFHGADEARAASRLRLINPGERPATVTARAVDDLGAAGRDDIRATVPPGGTFTLSAQELEHGGPNHAGELGDGQGSWRLTLTADRPFHAAHIVAGAGGFANLSAAPAVPSPGLDETVLHRIPYLPGATAGGAGFVRLVNDSSSAGRVAIHAFDAVRRFTPFDFALAPMRAVEFDVADLTGGNTALGLPGVGAGEGPWRLELATALPMRASAYYRDAAGLVTALNATAPRRADGYAIGYFPASEGHAASGDGTAPMLLRLVNWNAQDAAVAIAGRDERGEALGEVRLTVPARGARTLDAAQLEAGDAPGLEGALRAAPGAWRLRIDATASLQVMALQAGGGALSNLSAPVEPEDVSAAGLFRAHIASIVASKCVRCHVAGGVAQNARLVFMAARAPQDAAAVEASNLAAFEAFLAEVEDGASIVLARIQGVAHGGGVQVAADTEDHVHMAHFLAELGSAASPAPLGGAELFAGVRLETTRRTLRRAALLFAGRIPTPAEYAAVPDGDLAALRRAVRGLMTGAGFHEFLLRAGNDRLLTDRELSRPAVIDNQGYFVKYDNEFVRRRQAGGRGVWDWHHDVQFGAGRAPLELIAHVAENDLPYTEVLTADYIMANPAAAWVYGARPAFANPEDAREFQPGRILRYHHHGPGAEFEYIAGIGTRVVRPGPLADHPHAGLLNTKAFLQRYPTTATNRNRARARWAYYHFLGVDVERSAARTTDPVALADTDNPTLKNAACTVCHSALDPFAGAFQNYGESGYYRDKWGGLDALDYFYKVGAESAQAIAGASWATRSTLSWPLRPAPGKATIGFTYTNDFYDEQSGYDGAIHIDHLRVLDDTGAEIARHEFETAPPRATWGYCGKQNWNPATRKGDHLLLWNGGYPCAVHIEFTAAEARQYTAQVVAWATPHDRYGPGRRAKVSVVVDPYRQGDTWYRDMRPPGFEAHVPRTSDQSLRWLADAIVADERFGPATVRFWWPAVMGFDLEAPPATERDAGFHARLLAANAQRAEAHRLADGFRRGFGGGKPHNLKDLLVELALSPWFRAAAGDGLDPLRDGALRDAGAKRLLTPEELAAKTAALTGFEWGRWVHPTSKPHRRERSWLTDEQGYRLLYGGIDSDGLTTRVRAMTAVMAGVAKSHAAHVSCPIVLRELYVLPNAERRLFGGIGAEVSPHFELGANFSLDAAPATHTARGELTGGEKTVFLKFPNDFADARGDRNVYLDRLVVRDARGAVAQSVELETMTTSGDCNQPVDEAFAMYCAGFLAVPITIRSPGGYALDIHVRADLHGHEAPRLELVVEAAQPTAIGETAIKRKLVDLHEKLLGVRLAPTDPAIVAAWRLFNDAWARKRATAEPSFWDKACHWDGDIRFLEGVVEDAIGERNGDYGPYRHWNWGRVDAFWGGRDTSDPHFAARAWVVVLAHLLTDYRYLHL